MIHIQNIWQKKRCGEFSSDVMGNYTGIGIYLTKDVERNVILIISPIKDSPAYKAGILPGDVITKIDGESYTAEQLTDASNKIKGEVRYYCKIRNCKK